jgi:hypothetical protein
LVGADYTCYPVVASILVWTAVVEHWGRAVVVVLKMDEERVVAAVEVVLEGLHPSRRLPWVGEDYKDRVGAEFGVSELVGAEADSRGHVMVGVGIGSKAVALASVKGGAAVAVEAKDRLDRTEVEVKGMTEDWDLAEKESKACHSALVVMVVMTSL